MTLWIGYARSGQEFAVRDAIRALGITATVPRMVEAKRQGKRRWPDAIVTPALPNYIFIEVSNEDWHKLRGIKFLAATMVQVSETEASAAQCPGKTKLDQKPTHSPGPRAFLQAIEDDFEARMSKIEAGQRVEEYQPGETLRIMAGPFAGQLARFRRIVEMAHEPFPQIEAEGEMFGQAVRFKVDPVAAKRAV